MHVWSLTRDVYRELDLCKLPSQFRHHTNLPQALTTGVEWWLTKTPSTSRVKVIPIRAKLNENVKHVSIRLEKQEI